MLKGYIHVYDAGIAITTGYKYIHESGCVLTNIYRSSTDRSYFKLEVWTCQIHWLDGGIIIIGS